MSLTIAVPAQAAETPPKPITSTEVLQTVAAPPAVAVMGPPDVGHYLNANDGSWAVPSVWSTPNTKKTYQWLRNGVAIPGATLNYYGPQPADVGKRISYRVTGSATGFKHVTRTSDSTVPVWNKTPAPTLSYASPTPGQMVSASLYEPWAMTVPVTMKYQWLRNGAPISGATDRHYRLTTADVGTTVKLRVQGVNGTTIIETVYTASLKPSKIARQLTLAGGVTSGLRSSPQVGQRVSIVVPAWTQAGVKTNLQWLRNGTVIPGATNAIYTPVAADEGKQLTVSITGTLTGYATTVIAAGDWLHRVMPALPQASAPAITGTATVGSTLTAKKGIYRVPTAVWFQWQRNGVDIKGAIASTYKLTSADRAAKITVRSIEGSRPGYMLDMPTLTSLPVLVR